MKTIRYDPGILVELFRRQNIGTMFELQAALGCAVRVTVLRKLGGLGYRSSYSHSGRYYTLERFIRYDEEGLWFRGDVGFSRYGTLLDTVEAFVRQSADGYRLGELKSVLKVNCKESVLQLARDERIVREGRRGGYLYCTTDKARRRAQLRNRRMRETEIMLGAGLSGLTVREGELRAAILLFYSSLDEKQRRLYGGLESLRRGRGADHIVAGLLSTHAQTVAKGREELLEGSVLEDRVRRAGGGRRHVEKKRPM